MGVYSLFSGKKYSWELNQFFFVYRFLLYRDKKKSLLPGSEEGFAFFAIIFFVYFSPGKS